MPKTDSGFAEYTRARRLPHDRFRRFESIDSMDWYSATCGASFVAFEDDRKEAYEPASATAEGLSHLVNAFGQHIAKSKNARLAIVIHRHEARIERLEATVNGLRSTVATALDKISALAAAKLDAPNKLAALVSGVSQSEFAQQTGIADVSPDVLEFCANYGLTKDVKRLAELVRGRMSAVFKIGCQLEIDPDSDEKWAVVEVAVKDPTKILAEYDDVVKQWVDCSEARARDRIKFTFSLA